MPPNENEGTLAVDMDCPASEEFPAWPQNAGPDAIPSNPHPINDPAEEMIDGGAAPDPSDPPLEALPGVAVAAAPNEKVFKAEAEPAGVATNQLEQWPF